MKPSIKTVKRLCTLSSNRCAFYGCNVPLVDDESETFAGEICHIRASRKRGPRWDKTQTDEQRHAFSNLILLCSTHHTIIDSDVNKYSVEYLEQMKEAHNRLADIEARPIDTTRAERLLAKYEIQVNGSLNIGAIHAETFTVNASKSPTIKVALPTDVVGGSSVHRRYIAHLLSKYKKFAEKQPGREFKPAVIYKSIERKFGATWERIGLNRFEEISAFIQQRIDQTMLGKINRSKGNPNYSSFEGYLKKYKSAV